MTTPAAVHFAGEDLSSLASTAGTIVVLVGADKVLSQAGDHVDGLTGGNLRRVIGADGFKPSQRKTQSITWPSGMVAEKVVLASLGTSPDRASARQAGGAIASALADGQVTICTGGVASHELIAEMICAAVLRLYSFDDYRKATAKDRKARTITVTSDAPEALAAASAPFAALAE
ncbi:MAG: M17 family peptidase N-terminal domain-containing protein, partial [Pseudomonadota bacterium]